MCVRARACVHFAYGACNGALWCGLYILAADFCQGNAVWAMLFGADVEALTADVGSAAVQVAVHGCCMVTRLLHSALLGRITAGSFPWEGSSRMIVIGIACMLPGHRLHCGAGQVVVQLRAASAVFVRRSLQATIYGWQAAVSCKCGWPMVDHCTLLGGAHCTYSCSICAADISAVVRPIAVVVVLLHGLQFTHHPFKPHTKQQLLPVCTSAAFLLLVLQRLAALKAVGELQAK